MKNNTSANISVFNEKKYKNAKVIPLGQPKPSYKKIKENEIMNQIL